MIDTMVQNKLAEARQHLQSAQHQVRDLEEQARQVAGKHGIEAWLGNDFQSSASLTLEFADFSQLYKKHIVFNTKRDLEVVNWCRGHFEVSGFLRNAKTGKLVYISVSDVRYWPDEWYNHILIRTAEHNKDYTGGPNRYTTLPELPSTAIAMTS